MGKIRKLEKIMKDLCREFEIQEGVDITLGQNPARIYFTFEKRDGESYLNANKMSVEEVFKIAGRYGLQRDNSNPKPKPRDKFAFGFKLCYRS